jgi:DNA mismatch endonuclease, patch repair protein
MSRIRSKDTKPEFLVRKFLFSEGFRYKLHEAKLPGKPDLFLPKYKTAVFVDGCFWHGHEGCRYYIIPQTRTDWWIEKITETKKRDAIARNKLREMQISVITLYECSLKPEFRNKTLKRLKSRLLRKPRS